MIDKPLYHALRECQVQGDCVLATKIAGNDAGGQILLQNGKPVWCSCASAMPQQILSEIVICAASGIHMFDGKSFFVERFSAASQLVVCGGGHVATAVVRIAKLLGLPVLAIEDRAEYAQQLQQAGADTVLLQPYVQALEHVSGGAETYFVVVTRAHMFDVECLQSIFKKTSAYVGMMGSRGRSALVRRQLADAGIDPVRIDMLHAPIGLAIGAQSAQEIALSIMSEIVQVRNQRTQTEGFSAAILDAMQRADNSQQPCVLATIVSRHGSTPRAVGAKMLVSPDGTVVGSIGGGIMEHQTILEAQTMMTSPATLQQMAEFSADGRNDDAALAACGGSMQVLLQLYLPEEMS